MAGDIHKNPGPTRTSATKYFCKECGKTICSNQNVLLCVECGGRLHAKCLGLNKIGFKYYEKYQNRMWTCGLCCCLSDWKAIC